MSLSATSSLTATNGHSPRVDVREVKTAASGRWKEVFVGVGMPADILDGNHHPCPKCGGTDRFRMIDEHAGGLLCNQCFSSKNGDGIAAVGWFLDIGFNDALAAVADQLGIEAPKDKKKKKDKEEKPDPAKDLEWRPWSSGLVAFYVQSKPGVTEEAILRVGGRLARYKNFSVIAFPIIGESLDVNAPVGWVLVNAMGGTLPK